MSFRDDICLKQNKWSGLQERLAEQKRIFASVREEHIEIVEKLDESRHQLEDLQQSIPLKSEFKCRLNQLKLIEDELSQLELKIEELKLAARELKDRRNVRLFLPHEPLWPINSLSDQNVTRNRFLSIEESFDFR
jgi:predicted nuclease with TOPRIM domain